jgi:MFS family permease
VTELVQSPPLAPQITRSNRLPLTCTYSIEVLNSISSNLLTNGVAFYTTQHFGWTTTQNLLLMMAQGIVYAAGALSAGALAGRFAKPSLLLVVDAALMAMAICMSSTQSQWTVVPLLLAFTFTSTLTWPLVESLVTEGCDPVRMNRRVTAYNICWSLVGVCVIAVYGTILEHWPAGPMLIPVGCQALSLLCAAILRAKHRPMTTNVAHQPHGHAAIDHKLATQRRMALWLARLSLPASFVIANSLMGLFPKLAITPEIGIAWATVLASMWMASRFVTFIVLGMTSWWHTRPRLLIGAGVLMLLAFLMIVLPAERLGIFSDVHLTGLVTILVISELLLGIVAGFVFSASLYFGMVLSDGSAEHGGYHEALIGAGMVMGPGLAAGAQTLIATESHLPAIGSITALMLVTLGCALAAAGRFRPRA